MDINKLQGIILLLVASCGSGGEAPSRLGDVVEVQERISCRALWLCKGSINPVGYVSSTRHYPKEAGDQCISDLERQVRNMGQCVEGEMLDRQSIEFFFNNVETKLLTVNSTNGRHLAEVFEKMIGMLKAGCSGEACTDSFWPRLIDAYKALDEWDRFLKQKELVLSKPLLEGAIKLAARMCHINHDAEDQWLDRLWDNTFLAGKALISMQQRAGFSPVQCPRLVGQRPERKK